MIALPYFALAALAYGLAAIVRLPARAWRSLRTAGPAPQAPCGAAAPC